MAGQPAYEAGLRWGLGRRDCRLDFGMDLVRGSLTVDLAQQAAFPVVVGERRGLLIVDLQPPLHRLGPVGLAEAARDRSGAPRNGGG